MALTEARERARMEYESMLDTNDFTEQDIVSYFHRHDELTLPAYRFRKNKTLVGTSVNFISSIADNVSKMRDRNA